ncbi:MAG: hypothetical protein L6Q54_12495 [Leptospiraceae bacterium]|nr:hypothetical protein [Leptospiraceae bacterium]MCK6382052.1 hypothetical protein [Leptospiraceae bacterium]
MKFLFLIFMFFFISNLASKTLPDIKKYINFTHLSEKGESLKPEETCSYDNLKVWANFQSLKLLPDDPAYGLKDGICRSIPSEGLSFFLTADPTIKSTLYLYLDLTTYESIGKNTQSIQKLSVKINGKVKETIIFDYAKTPKNPAKIPVFPEEFPDGRIEVFLSPNYSSVGRFWGIWDVFYSYK